MTKVRIIPGNNVPGFGGLNKAALIEDGWNLELVVDVVREFPDGRITVQWEYNGELKRRGLEPHEYKIVEEGHE